MSKTFIAVNAGGALILATSLTWFAHGQETLDERNRPRRSGRQLFTRSEFGGNGRTCVTCHTLSTGDITLEHVQARFAKDPSDPLFRAIDSDDRWIKPYVDIVECDEARHVRVGQTPEVA